MRLSVRHTTKYSYSLPQARVVQSLRMYPPATEGQTPVSWNVSAEGAVFGSEFRDGAGDKVNTMTVAGPVEAVVIEVEGMVETSDTSGVLRGHREKISPRVYLRKTRTTAPGVGLVELSEGVSSREGTLAQAHELAGLVADKIAYTPGATHSEMTAAEALDLGHGVCQDHAQVLIAVARIRGVPARYVTGYLYSDAEGNSHEASHAWAELHVPDLGWVGFDPANKCCPDARYIRLGSGLDAQDAAPIRGISLGAAGETMDITVSVAQQQ